MEKASKVKSYDVTYTTATGEVYKMTIESTSLKEAKQLAQKLKRDSEELRSLGRLKTSVNLSEAEQREILLKRLKKQINEMDRIQKKYEKNKHLLSEDSWVHEVFSSEAS